MAAEIEEHELSPSSPLSGGESPSLEQDLKLRDLALKEAALKYSRIDLWMKSFTVLGVLFAALFGIYQYKSTAERDFVRPYWENRLRFYDQFAESASKFATGVGSTSGE